MAHPWIVNHHEKKATTCQSISQYDFRNKTDFRSTWRIAIYALSGPHISMLGFHYATPLPSTMFQVSSYHTIFSHLFKAEIKLQRVDQIRHFCFLVKRTLRIRNFNGVKKYGLSLNKYNLCLFFFIDFPQFNGSNTNQHITVEWSLANYPLKVLKGVLILFCVLSLMCLH